MTGCSEERWSSCTWTPSPFVPKGGQALSLELRLCPPGLSMVDDAPPALCFPLGKVGFAAQAVSQEASRFHLGVQFWPTRAEHNPTCSRQRLFGEHLSTRHVDRAHTHPQQQLAAPVDLTKNANCIQTTYPLITNKPALRPLGQPKSSRKPQHPGSSALVGAFIQDMNSLLVLTVLLQHFPHIHGLSSHLLHSLAAMSAGQAGHASTGNSRNGDARGPRQGLAPEK